MKPIRHVALALAAILFTASSFAADTYQVDTAHSTVGFGITHMVINTVHGTFTEFNGTLAIDSASSNAVVEVKGTIQVKSINTGVAKRDEHLRGADFFDVEKFPTITFVSKKLENQGGEQKLTGDFTMHGVTKELTLTVKVKGPIKDPRGRSLIGVEAKGTVNRKDYGLTYNRVLEAGGLMLGEDVAIEINAEASKAE